MTSACCILKATMNVCINRLTFKRSLKMSSKNTHKCVYYRNVVAALKLSG
jgi:hypothetical protein